MKACGLSVETDTSEQAVIKSIKASVKTISTKLEALKDLKAIEILNSLPSKYLSQQLATHCLIRLISGQAFFWLKIYETSQLADDDKALPM